MEDKSLMLLKESLSKKDSHSLTKRVESTLSARRAREQCLLLDVSGSMIEQTDERECKIDALRRLVETLPIVRQFVFSTNCVEQDSIPEPQGSTDMAHAFMTVAYGHVRHAVLVTDGLPDSERLALDAVTTTKLRLDIFYVGPRPSPEFLRKLARASGGQFAATTLRRSDAKQLRQDITLLLK